MGDEIFEDGKINVRRVAGGRELGPCYELDVRPPRTWLADHVKLTELEAERLAKAILRDLRRRRARR